MKASRIFFLLLGCRFFFFLATVRAGDSITHEFNIEEVEVVAKVLEKDIIRPQRLSADELRSMDAMSVADAVRYFSGVQLKDYGGIAGIKTLDIRSIGTNHVGIYYNGIPLDNTQNGQIDLGKFSLENIEEIDLYNGQKSDIFQSAREFGSAGSVYLNTRRPKFNSGEHFHVKGQMRFGSFGLINPSVSCDVRVSDKLSVSLNAELVEANGKYKFRYRRRDPEMKVVLYDTSAVRHNGDVHAVRVEGSINHYYSSTGFWKLLLYHYNSERGVPGAVVNNHFGNGERLWDRNSFSQLSWQDAFFKRWHFKVNAKYANDYTRYANYDVNAVRQEGNEYRQGNLYLSFANKVEVFKWWDVSLAYDFQWNDLRANRSTEQNMNASRYSHWLAVAMAFNFRNYLRLQTSVLGTFIRERKPTGKVAPNKDKCTPSIFLSYRPSQKVDFRFNLFCKQSYRYPTFNDLYYTDIGNAVLQPESATQYNIGVNYTHPFKIKNKSGSVWEVKLDCYYNYVRDKIVAYPQGQQFRWKMLNLGKVSIGGLDFSSSLSLSCPHDVLLSIKLQYTYQEAKDITDKSSSFYKHQIIYTPSHSGSVVGMLRWRTYSLHYSFIYVGERYDGQENRFFNYMQPWYTHDITLSGEWRLQKRRKPGNANYTNKRPCLLKLSFDINNLLAQDYEIIRNYPMPKTNYKCTISITY